MLPRKRRKQRAVIGIWKQSLSRLLDYYEAKRGTRSRFFIRYLKNIYFGAVMGISAMLPTFTHLSLSAYSVLKYLKLRRN